MENKMYAGFHSVVVQPPLGLGIPGYYQKRYAEGTADPLHLRATVFACGDEKAVIFNCECIGIRADAYDVIKKKVSEFCGIPEDAVYINCVHSHTSYIIVPPANDMDDMDIHLYTVIKQFADCAKLALADLKPCTISVAAGEAKDIAYTRRYRMKNGTVCTNAPATSPNIVGHIGTPDNQVRVIRIQREGAKEILIVSFATHADTIGGCLYTPDWPGYLVNTLNHALEGEVNTMFLLGCEGDLGTRSALKPDGMEKGVGRAKKLARQIAGAVLRVYDLAEPVAADTIRYAYEIVKVGKNYFDPESVPMAKIVAEIYNTKGKDAPELKEYPMYFPEALRIVRSFNLPDIFELRVSGLRIGDIAFVGLPGEPFASIGIEIAERSNMAMTVVTAITNGYQGYYPDEDAFAEPGYSYEKSTSPFAPDCSRKLIDGALAVIEKMQA